MYTPRPYKDKNLNTIMKRNNKKKEFEQINNPLSEELCEFIGAMIRDGCISSYTDKDNRSHYHISITGHIKLDKQYLTEKIVPIIISTFGKTPTIILREKYNAIILNIYSKKIFKTLTKRFGFIPGKKTKTILIPNEILNSSENYIFATIREIFDTDGSIFLDRRKIYKNPYPRITLRIASEQLFTQVKTILEKHFSVYTLQKSLNEVEYHVIVIYGEKQLEKWMELIGFSNPRHLNKINKNKPLEGFEPSICGLQNHCYTELSHRGIRTEK